MAEQNTLHSHLGKTEYHTGSRRCMIHCCPSNTYCTVLRLNYFWPNTTSHLHGKRTTGGAFITVGRRVSSFYRRCTSPNERTRYTTLSIRRVTGKFCVVVIFGMEGQIPSTKPPNGSYSCRSRQGASPRTLLIFFSPRDQAEIW